jgi:hypothetical protein
MSLILQTLVLLLLLGACTKPLTVRLDLSARDDGGRALSGLAFEVDGVRVATSDAAGSARATIHAARAGRLSVSVHCPEGYRKAAARSLPLGPDTPRLEVHLVCRPSLRTLVVAARVPAAPGAWLRVDGQPLGRIEPDGTLHAILTRPPDSDLRLSLDTSAFPTLSPQHPARDVHVADRDELIVFDPVIEEVHPRPARRTRTVRPPPTVLPYAIRAQR